MSISVDVAIRSGRIPLSRERVARIAERVLRAERVRDADLSITFLSNREIAALNRRHLGRSGPTDVISFELGGSAPGAPLVGDVYIAPDMARANARDEGIPVREELARLVVHGTLHALGYSHPEGSREERAGSPMWKRQESLLRRALATENGKGRRA
ncbi:MAG TPA: rRNA maturation RNase YbeY [Gemmatimonadaceae bacterium]|nr:rRNA maturation RNase YbeY [Gemmatimonadaceae bacterium]